MVSVKEGGPSLMDLLASMDVKQQKLTKEEKEKKKNLREIRNCILGTVNSTKLEYVKNAIYKTNMFYHCLFSTL